MANEKDNSLEPIANEFEDNKSAVAAVTATEELHVEKAVDDVSVAEPQGEIPGEESFNDKVKEWFRKRVVALKRNPQRIPLLFIVLVSIIWLLWLFTFSRTASRFSTIDYAGLSVFVNTLLSMLIIFLFLNAFPKRKKPKIVLIVLVFVFMAAMIAMDVLYYVEVYNFIYVDKRVDDAGLASAPFALQSLKYAIAHIVLQGVSIVLFALFPLYKKLLLKINTKKVIAGNNISESLDVED